MLQSFFGRSYNNLNTISECKNNGECVINKKNRTSCKACRLRKCLMVGMSKSGSRYGRRSNWFKIHCLLQEQQSKQEEVHIKEERINHAEEPAWIRWPVSTGVFPFFPPLVCVDDNFNRWDHPVGYPRPPSLTPPLDSPIDLSMKAPPSPISPQMPSPQSHSPQSPSPPCESILKRTTPLDLTTKVA